MVADPLSKPVANKNGLLGFVINKAATTDTASDAVATIYSKADTSILIGHGAAAKITVGGVAATDIRLSALNGFKKDHFSNAGFSNVGLHGSFLKADGKPNEKAELDKIIAIESVKKFLEGHYSADVIKDDAAVTKFAASFGTAELVFGTVKLAIGTTDATKAGIPSLPTMLHTYLKMASNPQAATDITHLEQLIPAVAVNNTWKTALGDGKDAASNAVVSPSGSETMAKGGQMETSKYLVDKATAEKAAGTGTLITTKAMPYLQFTTDSDGSSAGQVKADAIKIEFKAGDNAEGIPVAAGMNATDGKYTLGTAACKTVNDQTQLFDGVNPEILSSDVAIGKYKGVQTTLLGATADTNFIPNGILYFIVVGGSSNTESQAYATEIKTGMTFTDSSTTQAAAKTADTTEATATKAPETGGTKGRGAGTADTIVSVVHVRDYTPLAGKEPINKILSNKIMANEKSVANKKDLVSDPLEKTMIKWGFDKG